MNDTARAKSAADTGPLAIVRAAIQQALAFDPDRPAIEPGDLLTDLPGVSSLALLRALSLLESRLDTEFDDDDLAGVRTVSDVCDLVARAGAERIRP